MVSMDFRELFPKMVGGDEERFLRLFWRKRTHYVGSAVPELHSFYSYQRFIADYMRVNYHRATLLVRVDNQGRRNMVRVHQENLVREALSNGISMVLQTLLLPGSLELVPEEWRWLLTLYQDLCDYLLPDFAPASHPDGPVAALDIFCTNSETCTGGHYDSGDVFYFVLEGQKEWTVELVPDLAVGTSLTARGENYTLDRPALKEHTKIVVKPGDCLYVPPFTYHRVRSTGRSLAVSLGLPVHNEVSLLKTKLTRLQLNKRLFNPLPSYPRNHDSLFNEARRETKDRITATLGLLDI
jgi:ribosomal protein L16 Arg81 hydroxylase